MIRFPDEEFRKMKDVLVLYRCALKDMGTRIDILLEDFNNIKKHNPIEHVKHRLKSFEAIAHKLYRRGYPLTASSAQQNLTDIAGLRCICSYTEDIPYIVKVLKLQSDIIVINEKDYVKNPKPSGYRSYHLILEVPVYLTDKNFRIPVEIQVRTQAMDFWASLEHKIRYKYETGIPQHLSDSLKECAEQITDLDERMYKIQELIDMAY